MNSVTTRTLNSLFSLYEAHKKIILASKYLHVDETGIRVMPARLRHSRPTGSGGDEKKKARPNGSSGRGTTHQGFYWVYHNSKDKMVLFDYRPGRGREGPDDVLKNYQGYLQADARPADASRTGIYRL